MRRSALLSAFLCLLVVAVAPAALAAEKRVALVIGNSAYQHTPKLENPKNDATDVAAALIKLGFTVIEGTDLDKAAMDRKIRDFAEVLNGADVGVLFYAGHGLQVGGQNYLVPIDAKLPTAASLDFEMVRLDLVQRSMERETKTNIVFLDACRDNPLARNLARTLGTRSAEIGRGLATVESGVGTLISFSTQPGNIALDGDGRNSPYAGAVVKQLNSPGADIGDMLIQVRNDVMASTRGKQVPWEHSALTAKFYFSPPAPASPEAATRPAAPQPGLTYEQQMEMAFWNRVKDSKDAAELQAYVDRFPNGAFSSLARVLIDRAKREEAQRVAVLRQELVEEARKKVQAAQAAPPPTQVGALPTQSNNPAGPSRDAAPPPADREALVRSLQRELQRVGCDPGSADGVWGEKTADALKDFANYTKVNVPADEPSTVALDAVTGQKDRVCPLQCDDDEIEVKGKCVAKPSRSTAKAKTRTVEPKRQTQTRRSNSEASEQTPQRRESTPRSGTPQLPLGILRVLPF